MSNPAARRSREALIAFQVLISLLILAFLSCFFVVIPAGERGVLMEFGRVKTSVLEEGLHPILPLAQTVEKLSIRVQKQDIFASVASRDLQDVTAQLTLNWHLLPAFVPQIFEQVGILAQVSTSIVEPTMIEALKTAIAHYTAEEIITQRTQVKAEIDRLLMARLQAYHVAVDDIALVQVNFSEGFRDAVEAKQIAEQEAKRAEFLTIKAARKAEAKVRLAQGEARANEILKGTLTPEILQAQAIKKWNGKLPMIMGEPGNQLLDLSHWETLAGS
ncbi:prohibitin family protein [Synechocystis sp. LKSZ1]|uniref:prohibitin family protein n=1 Tax=Synechocystis sp. LKSZ1 TaxID=3144951 RepID=UPI00336BD738